MGNPFDWLEEGAITALICEPDEKVRGRIAAVLKSMDYHVSETPTPRDALKQMRGHEFNLVALNESFGTDNPDANHVLKFLDQLLMEVRRNIFVVLFSKRYKTMDNMMAFNRSVNMIINLDDIDNLEKILQRGINENNAFFRVYRESNKKLL
jgi:DNA-binding response OmpR family regulator